MTEVTSGNVVHGPTLKDIPASCLRRPTTPGATRAVRHRGNYEWAAAEAEGEAQELAYHHWFAVSQTYVPGSWGTGAWVLAVLAVVILVGIVVLLYMTATKPAGELVVVYEYRPSTPPPPLTETATAAPAQVAPAVAASPTDDTKTCPRCAEQVKAAALVCRFCRYEFGPTPSSGEPGI
jgi:hypothetical protein